MLSFRSVALFLLLCVPLVAEESPKKDAPKPPRKPVVVSDEALAIHREALVIDGHNDLPWELRKMDALSFRNIDLRNDQPKLHTDIPRLRKGGVGAQFWSAYVDVDAKKDSLKQTLEQIDVIHRLVERYPDDLELALTVDDIRRIRRSGKIASLIGVEGGHSMDNSLGALRMFYRLGVRYMTLTHSETLDWADSATDKPKNNGISKFGEDVVLEMNRLGMMVDISHVSADTMKHVLKITRAPVIFSHSSVFALADHPRNVPDDVLKLIPKNGGVVMVNFYPGFLTPEASRMMKKMYAAAREFRKEYPNEKEREQAMKQWLKENPIPETSIHTVCDHIEHIIKVAGVDHVGLGSDFDGIPAVPKQLEDVSTFPVITQELLNRGYKKEQLLKILGGNLLRVMEEVEKTAARKG